MFKRKQKKVYAKNGMAKKKHFHEQAKESKILQTFGLVNTHSYYYNLMFDKNGNFFR